MLKDIVDDRRVWTGDSLSDCATVSVPLEPRHIAAFRECIAPLAGRASQLKTIGRSAFDHPALNAQVLDVGLGPGVARFAFLGGCTRPEIATHIACWAT